MKNNGNSKKKCCQLGGIADSTKTTTSWYTLKETKKNFTVEVNLICNYKFLQCQ